MNMTEITPLHLSREWARLLKSGGHTRRTKEPRPMKPKTVRNIAGLVSSAYRARHQVGAGHHESGNPQRPAQS